jgi:hypothetical protein
VTYSSQAPDSPVFLAVVGGPTGSGKSTLVNSLVRAPVSPVGVLRPTTRQPVLAVHPSDTARVHRHGLRPIAAPMLPAGIALIDAPDIDSIEEANRALADELFDDADLWLFVITATRYADAAAWRHLKAAQERRIALAVVLDRVPVDSAPEIIEHLRVLLGEPEPPLFVIPESQLDRQGMLPEAVVAPLRGWLAAVVAGPPAVDRTVPVETADERSAATGQSIDEGQETPVDRAEGDEGDARAAGLDAETDVSETMQNKPRPTPQPVGAGRPSEGPPTESGDPHE